MASSWLKQQAGAPNAICELVRENAGLWRERYFISDLDPEPHFDRLFSDGNTFDIGDIDAREMLSPGHTLGSITYVAGDAAFAHDTFMQPYAGNHAGKCDIAEDINAGAMAFGRATLHFYGSFGPDRSCEIFRWNTCPCSKLFAVNDALRCEEPFRTA
jgi:glyoxylase-like metal-dependent hydrolase (beta-lactamase superfamily II)